jgi:hypothetical protein
MHFLFLLWSKTASIVLSTLSLYTCLQLYAHIKAIKRRPSLLLKETILLRNGLWGGDAEILFSNIERIECTTRSPAKGPDTVKLFFLKKLDNHNLIIHLKEPVLVTGAFGFTKPAQEILLFLDEHKKFALAVEERCTEPRLQE